MKSSEVKTNPMRYLDERAIPYKVHCHADQNLSDGLSIAIFMDQDPDRVFKTLVTQGKSKRYHVFMVPVDRTLDLKKAAASVDEKSVEMVRSKDLLSLTGYTHLGCSPLCIKRQMTLTADIIAQNGDMIFINAGKIGYQLELRTQDLLSAVDIALADISRA